MTTSKRNSSRNIVLSDRANTAGMAILILLCLCKGVSAAVTTYTAVDLYTLTFPPPSSGVGIWNGARSTTNGNVVGQITGPWGTNYHAYMWDSTGTPIDLNPTGFDGSVAWTMSGSQQVGFEYQQNPNEIGSHAVLWNSTNNAIDLNPVGFDGSRAYGIGGGQEVGYGSSSSDGDAHHALLWNGSNVAIDLHPTGFDNSEAYSTDGVQQVGIGYGTTTNGKHHALLWNGTNSAVDLNPAGFTDSEADGVGGGQQVGFGESTNNGNFIHHALLWNGTNAAIDLNPSGFSSSGAYDTNGVEQVGSGWAAGLRFFSGHEYALLWNGTNSAINLGTLLPLNFESSAAYAIDSSGNVYGIATAIDNSVHAVEWIPTVPEPALMHMLVLTLSFSLRARQRRS